MAVPESRSPAKAAGRVGFYRFLSAAPAAIPGADRLRRDSFPVVVATEQGDLGKIFRRRPPDPARIPESEREVEFPLHHSGAAHGLIH